MLLGLGLVAIIFSYVWFWTFKKMLSKKTIPHLKVDPTDFMISEGNMIFGNSSTAMYYQRRYHDSTTDVQKQTDFQLQEGIILIWFFFFTYHLAELWVMLVRIYMRRPREEDE